MSAFGILRYSGYIDCWDYFYRMNEVSLSQKVSDHPLTSMNIQDQGQLLAVGDAEGQILFISK